MDLTEAEDIKKRWQEYTEGLYTKEFHDPDDYDGVITDLESGLDEVEIGDKETSQEALVHIRKDADLSVLRNYCSEWSQH